ncbi:MAG: DUF87 domain-containing protein, partial [Deltaproteobacteria bacterium]|nr:DUF87 domain-containing protein [Deltaproteobacteria bacterium]
MPVIKNKINFSGHLKQQPRIMVFAFNILLAWTLYYFATGEISPFSTGAGIWLLAVITYWLLILITAPFFTPPKDSIATAISVILLLAPIDLSGVSNFHTLLTLSHKLTIGFSLIIIALALLAIFKQSNREKSLGNICYQLSRTLGRGEILFTPVILISVLGFYQNNIQWSHLILGFWVMMVIIKPIELLAKVLLYVENFNSKDCHPHEVVGTILRIDDPGIVRVSLTDETAKWKHSEIHAAHLPNNKNVYVLPLFTQIQNEEIIGTGLLCNMPEKLSFQTSVGNVYKYEEEGLTAKLVNILSGEENTKEVAGLVVENSTIGNIKFQVVRGVNLEEGMVVFCKVQEKKVYYQILDAKTDEESFQTNPYGMHIVSASQLGSFDKEYGFQKFAWLPEMNQPMFLVNKEDVLKQKMGKGDFIVGKIPSTGFEVPVKLDSLVEYHAAILGVTGTGKTELALEVIKNTLKEKVKVFCVDFTGEYAPRLKGSNPQMIGLSEEKIEELEEALHAVAVGTFGAKEERAALQKFLKTIEPDVESQIDDFLMDEENNLGIFELSEITNTRATLRITEMYLSSIMKWARKNRRARRVMIVLEEAHTIIPEVYSAGFDTDTQWIVGRIGQIALQGRKYGVGLLILSQRTALVSKTILSQCNTYFTHGLVDKTSLDYLGGVYSPEHVKVIPNLRTREFLASGKAVKSE